MSKNSHRGSDFRDFLNEQGILGEVESRALKQALSLQLDQLLKKQELTKTQMAARMKTSRAAVDRLLDDLQFFGHTEHAWQSRPSLGPQSKNRIGAGIKLRHQYLFNKKPRPKWSGLFFNYKNSQVRAKSCSLDCR